MTPSARVAAAITILDTIIAGEPAEKTLTNWARSNRYAGSGDRAAVRDHVYDALRCRRSYGALGGADSGRCLMIGAIRSVNGPLEILFSGEGYGADPLTVEEKKFTAPPEMDEAVILDCPDWLVPLLKDSLGNDYNKILSCLQSRAPLFLRVNSRAGSREDALAALAVNGIGAVPHNLSPTAIMVTEFPRRVQNSAAYRDGLVEIQDAASQALVDLLPLENGDRVLDFCAGGGGKSLAMSAQADVEITAYDLDFRRMRDLPARADRANVVIKTLRSTGELAVGSFDFVLCDVPCSGSGSWRRSPDGKWSLNRDSLSELCKSQIEILEAAKYYVSVEGTLAYATCSLLAQENSQQSEKFVMNNPDWELNFEKQFTPLDGGDGFYIALLTRV